MAQTLQNAPEAPGVTTPTPTASVAVDVAPMPERAIDDAGEELILDPELAGVPVAPPAGGEGGAPNAYVNTDSVRLVLRTRLARDWKADDPREEVWEATQLGLLEATVRRSESLRFELGVRMLHQYATLENDQADANGARSVLDASVTAANADMTVADGLHLRIGYQSLLLGRFDVFEPLNMLASYDLRQGPTGMAEGHELGQIATRVDYDFNSWLSLRAIYVPFMTPHVMSFTESDYAMFPTTQAGVDAAVDGIVNGVNPQDGPQVFSKRDVEGYLQRYLPRSGRNRIVGSGMAAFVPEPDFTEPQGAIRMTVHGSQGEAALTIGTALDHMPSIWLSDELAAVLQDAVTGREDFALQSELYRKLYNSDRPFDVRYNRYGIAALDGATDVGPVQVGVEASFMWGRTFYAMKQDDVPNADQTNMLQLGLRAEYAAREDWLIAIEGYGGYALNDPSDSTREWWMFEQGKYMFGAAGMLAWMPEGTGLRVELSGGAINGPSLSLAPRVGCMVLESLEAELGAFIVDGHNRGPGSPSTTIGGLYDDVDQVYVGLRYIP